MTQENDIHDKYKQEIMDLLNNSGLSCIDFESVNSDSEEKVPDLHEISNDILLEVKVLFMNDNLKHGGIAIQESLKNKGSASYWIVDTKNFVSHLDSCRRKFRVYPDKKTLVVFINLMKHQRQTLEELLSGEESFDIAITKEGPKVVDSRYRNREVRHDKNVEIGALAEYFPDEKRLFIVHNNFAEAARKIDPTIFNKISRVSQKEYNFDGENHFVGV